MNLTHKFYQGSLLLESIVYIIIASICVPIICTFFIQLISKTKTLFDLLQNQSERCFIQTIMQKDLFHSKIMYSDQTLFLTNPDDSLSYLVINNRLKRVAKQSRYVSHKLSIDQLIPLNANCIQLSFHTTNQKALPVCNTRYFP